MTIQPRSDGQSLRIVCTDRGQHRRMQLADYWHEPDRYVPDRVESEGESLSMAGPWPNTTHPEFSWTSYRFMCPMCGRDLKIRPPLDLFARVYDSGVTRFLDISLAEGFHHHPQH